MSERDPWPWKKSDLLFRFISYMQIFLTTASEQKIFNIWMIQWKQNHDYLG